jgi:Zn-dependent protease with chaperone function
MSWHDSAFRVAGNLLFNAPFRNLWPLAVAPALAALIADRTARLLPRTPTSSLPAAALAALPGLVALSVISQALQWDEVLTWRGLVTFRLTPLVACGLLAYAILRAARRQAEIWRLFKASASPSGRLERVASDLGLRARFLATPDKECFVAGLFRPAVFVSAGALERLSDGELAAALCHERSHVRGRDTLALFALSILRDLAPVGRGTALGAFRAAREASADRRAAAAAGPLALASALVALARSGGAVAGALPMARRDNLRWRMDALLEGGPAEPIPTRGWAGLAFTLCLVAWPIFQLQLLLIFCDSR